MKSSEKYNKKSHRNNKFCVIPICPKCNKNLKNITHHLMGIDKTCTDFHINWERCLGFVG